MYWQWSNSYIFYRGFTANRWSCNTLTFFNDSVYCDLAVFICGEWKAVPDVFIILANIPLPLRTKTNSSTESFGPEMVTESTALWQAGVMSMGHWDWHSSQVKPCQINSVITTWPNKKNKSSWKFLTNCRHCPLRCFVICYTFSSEISCLHCLFQWQTSVQICASKFTNWMSYDSISIDSKRCQYIDDPDLYKIRYRELTDYYEVKIILMR